MSEQQSFSFQVLFLDADRNPIKEQTYLLYFGGALVRAETGADGLTKRIKTKNANDEVQIAIERIDKSIKFIARVATGAGNKLVTVVSPRVKMKGTTLPHPEPVSRQTQSKKSPAVPIHDPKNPKDSTTKTNFGLVTEPKQTKDGLPITKVDGDIPNLEFLGLYNGEEMEDSDYVWAANALDVEYAAVKAFAVVESGGGQGLSMWASKLCRKFYMSDISSRNLPITNTVSLTQIFHFHVRITILKSATW